MTRWWMVRAGDNNELIPQWREKYVASIGWRDLKNPKGYETRAEFINYAHTVYSDEKPARRIMWASQVWRFANKIENGDRVITYNQETREYMIGTVFGEYEYNPNIIGDYYPNIIHVKWESSKVKRDDLSIKAKNSLGAISTIFRIDDWGQEIKSLLKGTPLDETESEERENLIDDYEEKSLTMIQDKIDSLDPWEMELLVAGLLRAMGYNLDEMKRGPDGGVDILAYKDTFGFEEPIIKVQVKHRKQAAPTTEIQQLLGANPIHANGLFVSTGGYTSPAINVANQNNIKLIDLEDLSRLLVSWYEKLPNETRSMIPMRKVYLPE